MISLPIVSTSLDVYKTTFANIGYGLWLTACWTALLIAATLLTPMIAPGAEDYIAYWLAIFVLHCFAWASIAVLWHRRLLLLKPRQGFLIIFDGRSFRYALRFLFIVIVTSIVMFLLSIPFLFLSSVVVSTIDPSGWAAIFQPNLSNPANFEPSLAFLLWHYGLVTVPVLVAAYVGLRMSMTLPDIAVDWGYPETAGKGLRLLAIAFLTSLPFAILIASLFPEMHDVGDASEMFTISLSITGLFPVVDPIWRTVEIFNTTPLTSDALFLGIAHVAFELSYVLVGISLLSVAYARLLKIEMPA